MGKQTACNHLVVYKIYKFIQIKINLFFIFEGYEDCRPYFIDEYGDIIITGCVFDHCYSINNNPGGSLNIKQDSDATIHDT